MKSLLVMAVLSFAANAHADAWLDSIDGTYKCSSIKDDFNGDLTIDSKSKQIKFISKQKNWNVNVIDETESLAIMQREVGFHKYKFIVQEDDRSDSTLMFKTSTGKLLIMGSYCSNKAKDWELPAFRPELLCEKVSENPSN